MNKFLVTLNLLALLLFWGSAASALVDGEAFPWLSVVGLAFPFTVAGVAVAALCTLLLRWRLLWLPLVGTLLAGGTLREYCPVNLTSPRPKGSLKVVSYNVKMWGQFLRDADGTYPVARHLVSLRPDVAALQEAQYCTEEHKHDMIAYFKRHGYHTGTVMIEGNLLTCVSKYPILRTDTICRSQSNGAIAFHLLLAPRDTLVFINAHLYSTHLSPDDLQAYQNMVTKPSADIKARTQWRTLRKFVAAARERAIQAKAVAHYVDSLEGKNIIVAGDFNDTPVSYPHHVLCQRLTDAYRATGNGIGRSYNRNSLYVRIDNIFCSTHWKPYCCHVDDTSALSDHYPLVAWFKRQ